VQAPTRGGKIAKFIGEYRFGSWEQMPMQNKIVAQNKAGELYSEVIEPAITYAEQEAYLAACNYMKRNDIKSEGE